MFVGLVILICFAYCGASNAWLLHGFDGCLVWLGFRFVVIDFVLCFGVWLGLC